MTIYTCSYPNCNKTFQRPSKLKNHYNLHVGVKPFVCTVSGCGKSYSTSSHLHRHIKCSHGNQSDTKQVFACPYSLCNATFQTLWGLQRHEDSHLAPFYCQKCNLHFKTDACYEKHVKRHEIVSSRKCQICGEDFSNRLKRDFLRHEKIHRIDHKCEFCGKMFTHLKDLQRHLTRHESRFECAHCGAIMTRKNSLLAHIRALHVDFVEPYVCEKTGCPKVYCYKRNCAKHTSQHCEHVRFKCPMANCCQEFLHKKSYLRHLQLHQRNEIKPKKKFRTIDRARLLVNALCS